MATMRIVECDHCHKQFTHPISYPCPKCPFCFEVTVVESIEDDEDTALFEEEKPDAKPVFPTVFPAPERDA